MKTVLILLQGPLQSWGWRSRFEQRDSGAEPSKSGVIGLVCNALGVPATDDGRLAQLAAARMAVRCDREGRRITDYHTVGGGDRPRVFGSDDAVVTHREYLSDARFLVALGFDDHRLADEVDAALETPERLLFLGRMACPPALPVRAGLVEGDAERALRTAPWPWEDRPERPVRLVVETSYGCGEPRPDQPVSFAPGRRQHRRRWVETLRIPPENLRLPGEPAHNEVDTVPRVRPAARAARSLRLDVAGVYASRIVLNPAHPGVIRDVADVHAMHRRVLGGFLPKGVTAGLRPLLSVLYRVEQTEGSLVLHVQARSEPIWQLPRGYALDLRPVGADNPQTVMVSWAHVRAGELYDFELRANALPRRTPKRARRASDQIEEWMIAEGVRAGFDILKLETVREGTLHGVRPMPPGQEPLRLRFDSTRFTGRLRVFDAQALGRALLHGIGRARPFGFGLLSLGAAVAEPEGRTAKPDAARIERLTSARAADASTEIRRDFLGELREALERPDHVWTKGELGLLREIVRSADPETQLLVRSQAELAAAAGIAATPAARAMRLFVGAGVLRSESAKTSGGSKAGGAPAVYRLDGEALLAWSGKTRPPGWKRPAADHGRVRQAKDRPT